jgi:SAM-dependent methyltransferase
MHETALEHEKLFFETYVNENLPLNIIEIGSQIVESDKSIRQLKPALSTYTGYDHIDGEGVDVVISHPYTLPIEDNSVDVIVSSSCFEHSVFFWMNFLEAMRVLKPSGLFYLNAPSNGAFHRYPMDSWRFYPDAGISLVNWGKFNSFDRCELMESFIGRENRDGKPWKDFVAVFLKDSNYANLYENRIIDIIDDFANGIKYGHDTFFNHKEMM